MAWISNGKKEGENGNEILKRRRAVEVAALALWLGGFHLTPFVVFVCPFLLPRVWAFTVIAVFLSQILIPTFSDTYFADKVARFLCRHVSSHFPIQVHVEDMTALDPRRSYLIAAEPHSVLPVGIIALTKHYGLLPLKRIRVAGSTALLWTPVVRHVWSWLGMVPANRKAFVDLLGDGYSVVLVPGGVQECLYLKPGQETIFLKSRYGFVRCAIETGSPLVPVFSFGQSETYHYLKPSGKWYSRLSRAIHFAPMLFWGMYGSPIPYPHPITVVVGKPIEVTKNPKPARDEITALLGKFIAATEALFEKHKAKAGYEDTVLRVV